MIYALVIIFVLFLIYAAIENLVILRVRRENFGGNIRIVHISDLHKRRFGSENSRLCRLVESEKPDMIFITGDFVSRTLTDLATARMTLEKLCRIATVYIIFGNHEQKLQPEVQKEFISMVRRTDAHLLMNDTVTAEKDGRKLIIAGLLESHETYKKNDCYRDLEKITPEDMEGYLGKCPEGEVVLLAHNPLFGEVYAEWGAEYVMSGHVHGGSVRLFGIALLSPERTFFPKYSKGVYEIGGTKLLVSAGLGKIRLFDPPEIVVYDI